MEVQLSHHYGWVDYDMPADILEEAAYLAVRQSHTFLTDENHSYEVKKHQIEWGGKKKRWSSVDIYRNECSPAPYKSSFFGNFWFAVHYRPKRRIGWMGSKQGERNGKEKEGEVVKENC